MLPGTFAQRVERVPCWRRPGGGRGRERCARLERGSLRLAQAEEQRRLMIHTVGIDESLF